MEVINGLFWNGADVEIWLDIAFDVDRLETVSKSVVKAPDPEIVSIGLGLEVLANVLLLLLLLLGMWPSSKGIAKGGSVISVGMVGIWKN